MKNICIDYAKKTIEITASFEKKARAFGSDEYKELREARKEFPNFKLVVKANKSGNKTFKGFNYDFMREYISTHDDEAKSISAEFEKRMRMHLSYIDVKQWFVAQFPVFKNCKTRADWILAA